MFTRTIGLSALALGVAMIVGSPASAQTSTSDSLKKLESDLKKLKSDLKELEGKLNKAGGKVEAKAPLRFQFEFSGMNKEKLTEMFKKWADSKKKEAGKGHHHWAGKGHHHWAGKGHHHWAGHHHHWASKGKGRGWAHGHHRGGQAGSSHGIEARVDHLIKELEDLRKQLKKK